jgi:hypothetical protein
MAIVQLVIYRYLFDSVVTFVSTSCSKRIVSRMVDVGLSSVLQRHLSTDIAPARSRYHQHQRSTSYFFTSLFSRYSYASVRHAHASQSTLARRTYALMLRRLSHCGHQQRPCIVRARKMIISACSTGSLHIGTWAKRSFPNSPRAVTSPSMPDG